jgi:hypothetical protein
VSYEQARQRSSDGKWAWTTMNDGVIWTSGGCRVVTGDTRSLEDVIRGVEMPEGATTEHHAHGTQEEAERCFWEWERTQLRTEEVGARRGSHIHLCEMPGCDEPATHTTWISGWGAPLDSCAAHAGTPVYDERHPFRPGLRVVHS